MSKGSPIIPVRIPAELLSAIDKCVAELGERTAAEPPTRSSWILRCIRAELARRERARTWRGRKRGAELPDDQGAGAELPDDQGAGAELPDDQGAGPA